MRRCRARAVRSARLPDALTPARDAGDFAQGMMDLGATVCTARAPRCLICPLRAGCRAAALGVAAQLPVKQAKAAKPLRRGRAWWIVRAGAVWLVQRPAKGLLGGMRALPDDGWTARADGTGAAPIAGRWRALGTVRHGFTHFDLELQLMLCEQGEMGHLSNGVFWPTGDLESAGLPTVFAKAARLALAQHDGSGERHDAGE